MQRCGEFRESKEDKKSEAHPAKPEKAKPGAFWVVEGMRTVGNSKNQARKPGAECIPFPYNSCKKETGENPCFRRFCGRDRRTWSRLPPRVLPPVGSAKHRPRREPRPARQSATGARAPLGKRFWGGCGNSLQGVGKCRCWPVSPQVRKGAGCGRRPSQRAHNPSFLPIQEGYAWGAEIAGNLFLLLPCVAGVNQSFASEYITPVGGLFFQCTRGTILSKS